MVQMQIVWEVMVSSEGGTARCGHFWVRVEDNFCFLFAERRAIYIFNSIFEQL